MEELIELLKQIQDLAGAGIDALESVTSGGGAPEGGGLVGLAALRRVGPVDRPRVDQVARPRDGLTVLPSAGGRGS